MKKFFLSLLTVFLALCLTACGVYTEGNLDHGKGGSTSTKKEDYFTITLQYEDQSLPDAGISTEGMEVQLTDGYSYYETEVGEDGVARLPEVEGSYNVTLTGIPDGYTYNPNVYKVSNAMPSIIVDLYKILRPTNASKVNGTTRYNQNGKNSCYTISEAGIYRVTLKDANTTIYYEYRPPKSGSYGIESICSTAVNKINPKAGIYIGTFAWKPSAPNYVLDAGGQTSTYTKNFKYDVQLTDDMVGNVFTFAVSAKEKNGQYPITVDFAVVRVGEFTLETKNALLIVPSEIPQDTDSAEYTDFIAKHHTANVGKTWTYPETELNGVKVFDGSRFYLSSYDGYYHVDLDGDDVNGEKTDDAQTGADPILYAQVSQASRFLDPLNTVEDAGNKNLTIGDINYKLFVEGFSSCVSKGYFCVSDSFGGVYCSCQDSLKCVLDLGTACLEGCEKCHPQCRNVTEEQLNAIGYADVANAQGAVPVTAELQAFLQKYSVSQRLYNDGNGWAESGTVQVNSTHDDQWLFACGYYM